MSYNAVFEPLVRSEVLMDHRMCQKTSSRYVLRCPPSIEQITRLFFRLVLHALLALDVL